MKFILYCIFIFSISGTIVFSKTIHIPEDFQTIQEGIYKADNGDTVLVAPGEYSGRGNYNLNFMGKEIVVKSEKGQEYTTINCQDTARGVYFHNNETRNSIFDGFEIKDGKKKLGGAIKCVSSSPTIINCLLRSNTGSDGGGGIYCNQASPKIMNCIIEHNSIKDNRMGAGILCENRSNPVIRNNFIYSNYSHGVNGAFDGAGISCNNSSPFIEYNIISGHKVVVGWGAGIYCYNLSDPKIISNTITDNEANVGGGIYLVESSPLIEGNIISGNKCHGSPSGKGGGAGISCYLSSTKILNNIISNNEVINGDGGGIACSDVNLVIEKNEITDNYAEYSGGGIECSSNVNVQIINNLIKGNIAENGGGGVFLYDSISLIMSNTICLNNGNIEGGSGIYCLSFASEIVNNIVFNNSGDQIKDISKNSKIVYCDIENGWKGRGNINKNPLFIDPAKGNFNLRSDSPCIDAGFPQSEVPYGGGCRIDMGAYEFSKGFNCMKSDPNP